MNRFLLALAAVLPLASPALATPTESLIHTFRENGGATITSGLIIDKNGVLYGTALTGGGRPCLFGCGSVYTLTPQGSGYRFKDIYLFQAAGDGYGPDAALLRDTSGTLFGTTGGTNINSGPNFGTVFMLKPSGPRYVETVLHEFSGEADGEAPGSPLIADKNGSLFGTARFGGTFGGGTVFKLTPNGTQYSESTLYSFQRGRDGELPNGLTATGGGVIVGTTQSGGKGYGTVFELTPAGTGYTKTTVHLFGGGADGAHPQSTLLADGSGTLYGVTESGGTAAGSRCKLGCGTVFALTPAGSSYTETVLYRFLGGKDGIHPIGSLIGNGSVLYGTTDSGGSMSCGGECGTAFELTRGASGYTKTILHDFSGGTSDGADVDAGLTAGSDGVLFGTTFAGASTLLCYWGGITPGCGSVYEIQL